MTPMHNTPQFVTSADVCEQLQIDRSTLSRWVAFGKIDPVQKLPGLRGAFLFTPEEVERVALDRAAGVA